MEMFKTFTPKMRNPNYQEDFLITWTFFIYENFLIIFLKSYFMKVRA